MEKYLVKVTLLDGTEYYVCKGAFTKYTLDSNILKGIHFDLEEAEAVEILFRWYVYPVCKCRRLPVEQNSRKAFKSFLSCFAETQ